MQQLMHDQRMHCSLTVAEVQQTYQGDVCAVYECQMYFHMQQLYSKLSQSSYVVDVHMNRCFLF